MRVLVTGGAGFIGSHVVDALIGAGHTVRVLDALLPAVHRTKPEINDSAEFLVGDVTDRATVEAALGGVEAVCHQAAMVGLGVDLDDLPVYATHNDLGTAVLLAAMARCGTGRLVLASSMVVYGEGGYRCPADGAVRPGPRRSADLDSGAYEPPCPRCERPLHSIPVTESAPLDPRNVYAATKVAQEHLAAAWAAGTGGTAVALRYHNVYGPRMPRDTPYAGVASIFRSALERGEPPLVHEDGGQLRDFVHVHDVARANLAALRHCPDAGHLVPVNVGSGQAHTVGEMARPGARVRRTRARRHRPVPDGRRPAHRRLLRPRPRPSRPPGDGHLLRRDGRLRPRPTPRLSDDSQAPSDHLGWEMSDVSPAADS